MKSLTLNIYLPACLLSLLLLSGCGPLFEHPEMPQNKEVIMLAAEITGDRMPSDSDRICPIESWYGHAYQFQNIGMQAGEPVPDFSLYGVRGELFNLKAELIKKKPVFLFSLSYTNPKCRENLQKIEKLYQRYGEQVTFCGVYTLETRPSDSMSPYEENLLDSGLESSIAQHQNYGDRWKVLSDVELAENLSFPIVLDDFCNNFWKAYDRAPHAGYLVRPNGHLYSKHGWLDVAEMEKTFETYIKQNAPKVPV